MDTTKLIGASKKPKRGKGATISFGLEPDLKDKFTNFCGRHGVESSVLFRNFIVELLDAGEK